MSVYKIGSAHNTPNGTPCEHPLFGLAGQEMISPYRVVCMNCGFSEERERYGGLSAGSRAFSSLVPLTPAFEMPIGHAMRPEDAR